MAIIFAQDFSSCGDWIETDGAFPCSPQTGTWGQGNNGPVNGEYSQITTAAAYSPSGSARGFRQWKGDGTNVLSMDMECNTTSGVDEFWFRWYMRHQSGFAWTSISYAKYHYIRSSPHSAFFGLYGNAGDGNKAWGVTSDADVSGGLASDLSWNQSQGGATGDGQWHCYEYHLRRSPMLYEFWFDGTQYGSKTGIDMGTGSWSTFGFTENQAVISGNWSIDIAAIKVSDSGYIGPISSATTTTRGSWSMR